MPALRAEAAARGVEIGAIRIGLPRTRWGSRSARGTISLSAALLFLEPAEVRSVLLHELAHVRHMHHGPAFWALLEAWDPGARASGRRLRGARERVPAWARPPRARRNPPSAVRRGAAARRLRRAIAALRRRFDAASPVR